MTASSGGHSSSAFSVDELKGIAKSITAAGQINDPNTWLDAAEAIPIS